LEFIPGSSGRSNFAGTFYFRNSIIYHSAKLFLNDPVYHPVIQSIENPRKKITLNEMDDIKNANK
jgi:hypothetical protein